MNGGEPSVWSVVSVSAPDLARTERGPAAVQHAEWVRLFLGRALAPSRLVGPEHAPSAVEYLVSGIDVSGTSHRDDAASIEAAHAVATDFEGLRDVIAYHRERIERCAQDPTNAPLELFLTTYPMLMCVTVSDDPADWQVTDQGLCIVRWGLRGPRHRPLLQWTAQELEALQRRVIAAAGLPDVAPGDSSYSRVAKSAWKVIKDDEERQRFQKVSDGAMDTEAGVKVASGNRLLSNPRPVVRRAAWMRWMEAGLVALALVFVVSAAAIISWKQAKKEAETAKNKAVDSLKMDAEVAQANAVAQAKKDAEAAQAKAVEQAKKDAEVARAKAFEQAKQEAEAAQVKVVERPKKEAEAAKGVPSDSASGVTSAVAGPELTTPAPSVGVAVSSPKPSVDNDRRLLLERLASLYKTAEATDDQVAALAARDTAKGETVVGTDKFLERCTDKTYLSNVWGLANGKNSQQFLEVLPRMSVNIPTEIFEVLKKQNVALAEQHALILLDLQGPQSVENGKKPKQFWYWLTVPGAAKNAFEPLDTCMAQFKVQPVGTFKMWKIAFPGLVVYDIGASGSTRKEWYAWGLEGDRCEPYRHVPDSFDLPGENSHKIEDLVDALSGFAGKVMLDNPASTGQKKPELVRMPAVVAFEFAKETLRRLNETGSLVNPEPNSANEAVRAWCESLLAVLEAAATDGRQRTIPDRMKDFKERLEHPPFFPAAKPTCVLLGALSVSGINKEIVGLAGPINDRVGQLAAFDGTVLRHIGYLKDGKAFFDLDIVEFESLLGCAVFVVESANPKQAPNK